MDLCPGMGNPAAAGSNPGVHQCLHDERDARFYDDKKKNELTHSTDTLTPHQHKNPDGGPMWPPASGCFSRVNT